MIRRRASHFTLVLTLAFALFPPRPAKADEAPPRPDSPEQSANSIETAPARPNVSKAGAVRGVPFDPKRLTRGASKKQEADAPPAAPSSGAVQAAAMQPPPLQPAWSARVGSTASDDGSIGFGQIALRGSLIAVASRGVRGMDDELDGVHIFDGRSPPPQGRTDHRVRFIPSPPRPQNALTRAVARVADLKLPPNAARTDAIGVALDGDFVVFGTYGGAVTKARLDGVVLWTFDEWPAGSRPGLAALGDMNGDGVRDAIVPVVPVGSCAPLARAEDCADRWQLLAIVLDGQSGNKLSERRDDAAPEAPGHSLQSCPERIVSYSSASHDFIVQCATTTGAAEGDEAQDGSAAALATFSLRTASKEQTLRALSPGPLHPSSVATGFARSFAPSDFATLESISDPEQWLEAARAQLQAGAQSAVSIGDVDGDGAWEALVVQGDQLRVYPTRLVGSTALTQWRGDSAATGEVTAVDSPSAYNSRIAARDKTRWLELDRAASDPAFESSQPERGKLESEPVVLPPPGSAPLISARVDCDGSHYALNEGHLLQFRRDAWRVTSGAPWPILALGCQDRDLVLEGRAPLGKRGPRHYVLQSTTDWKRSLWAMTLSVLLAALFAAWWLSFAKSGTAAEINESESGNDARRAVMNDRPRTRLAEAHPSQLRLLKGLLNVLDNDDTKPPLTLALYGAWGSGKSSLMSMLRNELRATGRYIDVWFNAWRFQREPELAPALLQCIVDEVAKQTDPVTRVALLWHRIRCASATRIALVGAIAAAVALVIAICAKWLASGADASVGGKVGAFATLMVVLGGSAHKVIDPLMKVFAIEPAKLLSSKDSTQRIQFVGGAAQRSRKAECDGERSTERRARIRTGRPGHREPCEGTILVMPGGESGCGAP